MLSNSPAAARRRLQNRNAQRNHRNNIKQKIESLEKTNNSLIHLFLQNNPQRSVQPEFNQLFENAEYSLRHDLPQEHAQDSAVGVTSREVELQPILGTNILSKVLSQEKSPLSIHGVPQAIDTVLSSECLSRYNPNSAVSSWSDLDENANDGLSPSLLETWSLNSPGESSTALAQNHAPAASNAEDGYPVVHRQPLHERKENTPSPIGQAPLTIAIANGHVQIAQFLIANGADPNAIDEEGRTPLHLCAETNNALLVETLVAYGASVGRLDQSGRTPLQLASSKGSLPVVEKLVEHGAKVN